MTDSQQPLRIQLSRRAGWRMPPNTVRVCRPGPFGNPHRIEQDRLGWWCMLDHEQGTVFATETGAQRHAVTLFCEAMDADPAFVAMAGTALAGRNLACWCDLCPAHAAGKPFDVQCDACAPCHADALGRRVARLACEAPDG